MVVGEEEIKKRIAEIINQGVSELAQQTKIAVNEFHASMMGLCLRYLYYIYKNEIEPKGVREIPFERLKILGIGKLFHQWLQSVLSEKFFVIHEGRGEETIDINGEKVKIIGTFDTLLILKKGKGLLDDKDIIIEIKTVSSLSGVRDVLEHHLMQVNFYMNSLNIDDGFIIYLDRDNFNFKIFHVKKDEALYEKLKERVISLYTHIKGSKLPPAEARFDSNRLWECKYCPYVEMCDEALKRENADNR